ncbi:hypothetical protein KAJ89_04560 [Candidatus Parcubacteria bacterium]|nr:hypothetical protein [Candidatus Parcubacteria bacterium]
MQTPGEMFNNACLQRSKAFKAVVDEINDIQKRDKEGYKVDQEYMLVCFKAFGEFGSIINDFLILSFRILWYYAKKSFLKVKYSI